MTQLYRLVYASKNLLAVPEAEANAAVSQILAASQRNNAAAGVTGALMFNGGAFAQVLEGPRQDVERTFERIQRDERHGDVTVLECGPTEARGFADWSMAYVGRATAGEALWSDLGRESGFDLSRLDGDAIFRMLHGLVLEEEGLPSPAPAFDADRVRAEVSELRPDLHAPLERGAVERDASALAVLRQALAEERRRTTELRGALDDARIAEAQAQNRCESLCRERDLWVERARGLAAALCREAEAVRRGPAPDQDAATRAA